MKTKPKQSESRAIKELRNGLLNLRNDYNELEATFHNNAGEICHRLNLLEGFNKGFVPAEKINTTSEKLQCHINEIFMRIGDAEKKMTTLENLQIADAKIGQRLSKLEFIALEKTIDSLTTKLPPRKPYINEDGSVNWSLVPVDTKVVDHYGCKRYFSHYKYGEVYIFSDGRTSWNGESTTARGYSTVKLADE